MWHESKADPSDYQIVFYRMLSPNPITVGLESPLFQAAGKISRLLEDLLASGTLYDAPFIMYVPNPYGEYCTTPRLTHQIQIAFYLRLISHLHNEHPQRRAKHTHSF